MTRRIEDTPTPDQIIDYWTDQARIINDRPTNVTITRRELGELLFAHELIVDEWRTRAVTLEAANRALEGRP